MSDSPQLHAPNQFNQDDLLALLLALQNKINRELHVASLCVVEKVTNERLRLVQCRCFPNAKGKDPVVVNAFCLKVADLDTVRDASTPLLGLILMTDMESDANATAILNQEKFVSTTVDSTLHSWNNAVLVMLGDPIKEEEA